MWLLGILSPQLGLPVCWHDLFLSQRFWREKGGRGRAEQSKAGQDRTQLPGTSALWGHLTVLLVLDVWRCSRC